MTYKLIDYEDLKAFSESLKSKYATKNELPTELADLQEDTTHRVVTDAEKKKWNDKVSQSQITSDVNSTGTDKAFSVDVIKQQLANKIDKSRIVDSYVGNTPDAILSQKAINMLVGDYNDMFEDIKNSMSDAMDALSNSVPTKLSQLTNDKTFKTESEIQQMIEKASSLKKEVVSSLPTSGKDDVIYLVKDPKGKDNNNYLEYLWLNGKYELIGSTQVDLSGYVQQGDLKQYQNAIYALQNDMREANDAVIKKLDKHDDKALVTPNIDWENEETYTTPKFVANAVTMLTSETIGDFDKYIGEELQKTLKTTDIQEFTQQELEEAFK